MSTETTTRGARKLRKGVVASKMGAKSVVVTVCYRERHPVYGKIVTRTKKYHVHDEDDTAKVGDTVTIMECRPLSATKRWRIVK
jgi:small subunit ribosomal protein S17